GGTWSSVGSGTIGTVNALAVFDDGGGPALYAGGSFTSMGGVPANSIAKWNGATWSPLGTGIRSPAPFIFGVVYALAVYDGGSGAALYAGGFFGNAGGVSAINIAKWDGATWSSLGSGIGGAFPSGNVYALTTYDDGGGAALYAGGSFGSAGGVAASNVAKW